MIELINVNKTYKTKKRTTKALVDCNLSFPEKGLFFLTGESGSGKSTFLRIVSMQDSDFEGKLLMQGRDAQSLSFAERASFRASFFGFVSQDLDLIDALTVRENLTLAKDMTGEETDEKEVLNILSRLDLPKDILDEKPENLSGGQRQRVAIGRALLKDCKVLACDEPTGNLDDDNAESVMKTLKDLSSERLVLVASHNPYLAEKYADAIIHFEEGVVESFKMGSNDADMPSGFTTKKTSLQPKTAFKLAVSTLKSSTKKLVFAGVSTVLATSFMLSTFSLHEFNMDFAMQNAIANEGVKSFRVRKSIQESIHYSHYEKMNESDIEKARTFFPSVAAYFDYPGGIEHLYRKTPSTGEWVVARVQNVNLIDASTFKLDDFSFPLIGSLPKQGEVLLTRYQLVEWGIVDPGASFDEVALARAQEHGFNFEDTVRNEVKMMAVSGIVDTGYPFFAPKKTENTHYQQKVASCYIEEMHGNALISHEDALVFQKDLIEFERKTSVPYGGFFVSAEKTKVKDVETFSKMLQENDPKARARASTRFSSSYTSLSAFQSNWETTLMLVGTVLSLFSLFFFGSFLLSVTSNNRDAWTILFNLGAKKWDVYKVLLMQSALISAGTVIVSLVPYGFGILGIDLYMNHVLSSAFFPLTLSYIGFFASLGVLLLVGALASWVALLGLRGKKNKKN